MQLKNINWRAVNTNFFTGVSMWPCFNDITGRSAAVDDLILFVYNDAVDETLYFAQFHIEIVHSTFLRLDPPDLQRPVARANETLVVKMHFRNIICVTARIIAGEWTCEGLFLNIWWFDLWVELCSKLLVKEFFFAEELLYFFSRIHQSEILLVYLWRY